MGIAIPSYGNPGFIYNEDIYTTGYTSINERGLNSDKLAPQEVVIICENKNGRVSGILNGGVRINGHAEWTEMMGGGIMSLGGSMIETGNNLLQFVKGSSIQQPWMNRKMWKTTKPFSFDIPMSFVATTDPIDEVIRPAFALMSFICPRQLKFKNGDTANIYNAAADTFNGFKDIVGGDSLAGTAMTALELYNIPGPALRYGTDSLKEGEEGDPVKIVVGKLFAFGACYLEDVGVEFSQAVDTDGYPIAVKVNVKATVMDATCCESNGDFLIQEFSSSSKAMGDFLDQFKKTQEDTARDLANIVKKGIGFYKTALKKN